MKFYRVLFLLPVLMILTAAGPNTPSGTRQAKGVVDVWSNLDFRPNLYVGHQTVAYDDVKMALCREMGSQAHEMLWIAPEALTGYVTFEPTVGNDPQNSTTLGDGSSPERSRLTLSITLDEKAQPLAREFLDKMVAALPGVVDQLQRQYLVQHLQKAKVEAGILRAMGMNARTAGDISALTRDLDQQMLQMELDVAALSAERDVLVKTVAQINAEAAQKAQDDPVAIELQKIVDLKEKKLELLQALQKVGGNQSATESSDAETSAAEAQVQLLERREAVERSAGGDELGDLQKQLVQAEVSLAQDMARRNTIAKESIALNQALDLQMGIDTTPPAELQQQLDAIPKAVVRVVSEE